VCGIIALVAHRDVAPIAHRDIARIAHRTIAHTAHQGTAPNPNQVIVEAGVNNGAEKPGCLPGCTFRPRARTARDAGYVLIDQRGRFSPRFP
jgi:hypothetical protein